MKPTRLFAASCVALIVTAMTFAIRAGILTELSKNFALTDTQLGWVNSMAFLGFPVAMMVLGLLYNALGPKVLLMIALIGHIAGLVLTITASGFWGLIISTFCIVSPTVRSRRPVTRSSPTCFPRTKRRCLTGFTSGFRAALLSARWCPSS